MPWSRAGCCGGRRPGDGPPQADTLQLPTTLHKDSVDEQPRPRSDPADARSAHDLARDQERDAARLGVVGQQLQRRHGPRPRTPDRDRERRREARLRSDAGQRHLLGRGSGEHAGASRWPCAGPDQRRIWETDGEADPDDGPEGHHLRNRRRRSDDGCRRGKSLIVDAMSSFGAIAIDARKVAFDALVAASGKCVEGPPGMGFVFVRRSVLEQCAGNSTSLALDLYDQWAYMEKTTQWRYTPPTHVVVALDAALTQYDAQGGQPARLARYTANYETLVAGMAEMGFRVFLDPKIQAPIIVTFHAPAD